MNDREEIFWDVTDASLISWHWSYLKVHQNEMYHTVFPLVFKIVCLVLYNCRAMVHIAFIHFMMIALLVLKMYTCNNWHVYLSYNNFMHKCLTLTVPVTTIDALGHFETG